MLEDTVKNRTQELLDALQLVKKMSEELVQRLTVVAEYRDEETGAAYQAGRSLLKRDCPDIEYA